MEQITSGKEILSTHFRTALRLETISLVWMVMEAAGAIGAGVAARSVLLVAFGIDSIIEPLSASLLM